MSEFLPGLSARHDAAAAARCRATVIADFAATGPRVRAPVSDSPPRPRHFSPADPASRPTAGWNPLDPEQPAASPFLDPLAAAHAAGFAEGQAAAHARQQAGDARDGALMTAIAEQLAAAGRVDREAMARRLRDTVLLLVRRLVGETGVSADLLAERIEAATGLLADAAESALLRVHPDDVALLDGRLPRTVFAAGDAAIARGSFVLEAASTVVEDGPELWLEQLARAIEAAPLPRVPC